MKNTSDMAAGCSHKFQNIGESDCSFDSINLGFFEQPNLFSDGIKVIPNFGTKDLMGLLKCSRSKLDSFRHRNGLPEGSIEKKAGGHEQFMACLNIENGFAAFGDLNCGRMAP